MTKHRDPLTDPIEWPRDGWRDRLAVQAEAAQAIADSMRLITALPLASPLWQPPLFLSQNWLLDAGAYGVYAPTSSTCPICCLRASACASWRVGGLGAAASRIRPDEPDSMCQHARDHIEWRYH